MWASFWQKVSAPLQSCCDMRDQSGKCILQHVSQSIGTPSVLHCVGTGRGGIYGGRHLRWRRPESACTRAARTKTEKRCWPLAGVIHSGTNEHVNKSSVRALEFLPLYRSVGASPLSTSSTTHPQLTPPPPPPLCNLPRQEAQLWSELCHHFTSSRTPATTKCGRLESVARTKIGFQRVHD